MRKRPFKNCSKFMTGGSFKQNMANMFSSITIEESKKEPVKKEETDKEKSTTLKDLEESYRKILKNKKEKKVTGTARKVYFPTIPDVFFISFKPSKTQAAWEASKFFGESYHPSFIGMKTDEILKLSKVIRIPELDEFSKLGKVPILKLMQKANLTFSCEICGRHHFTYEDYCKNLCFLVEDEWNSLPYTTGYVLCYKCHEKFI